ncbi:spermine oxidase [Halictus rubicundus]|uniref:spermine oxidase n=1 Tax=Halictus rubicundus TaxID=77578 RepID=UPI00403500C2
MYRYVILLFFGLIASLNLVQANTGSPRVVIVGAGASGIAAATKLLQNGIEDILILEAEDRIGGRVKTVKFDEYLVDQGAQWIHGDTENVVYDMAAPLNLTDHSDPYLFEMFMSNGEQLDPGLVENITKIFIEYLETNDDPAIKNCNASFGECVADRAKQRLAEYPELNNTMQEQLLWIMNLMLTSLDPGDTWYDVAMEDYDEELRGDRGINWKSRGYSTILDIMMKKIPNPEEELPVMNKTILNAEVTKVDYSSEDGTVKLTTDDGNEYTADHVIMTPSLGVLKADYETLFTPQLSDLKIKAIKTRGYGNACKVHLAFNDSWFNEEGAKNKLLQLVWTEDQLEMFDNAPQMWVPYTMSFHIVEHKPRLLMLWVSGRGGRLIDDHTDDEVLEQVTEILQNFFSKSYNVSEPVAMIRSNWHQNKHFRGTYSYTSLESAKANVGAKELAEPVMKNGKPIVLFAGEATATKNSATVHGAIETGWREAERLINLYTKTDSTTE